MEGPSAVTPPAPTWVTAAAPAPAPAAPAPTQEQSSAEPEQTTTTADDTPATSTETTTTTATPSQKPVKLLIVDTGPLIKNDPPLSTLLAKADEIYTLPSVLTEIRDEATRSRVQTQLLPFLKLRSPRPESVKFVQDFARRTGDLEVLSKPDIHLIALTYELECEKNGGDWRLRKTPGQKTTNGKSPAALAKLAQEKEGEEDNTTSPSTDTPAESTAAPEAQEAEAEQPKSEEPVVGQEEVSHKLGTLSLAETTTENTVGDVVAEDENEDDDEDGWITPSNLKKHQAKDQVSSPEQPIQRVLQVALLTSDFAMQNVTLRINLNLLSPSMSRITRVKTWVLRCHGCFQVTRQMDKQFCPKCGQPTLTRVSATTDSSGNFTVHLKKNFQFNKRGNVYSIPKGGGKGGWGTELLLAEDQKEYTQKVTDQQRLRTKDLMDEDYLPGILTGNRKGGAGGAGRPRVGAGRTINSKKRHG
ncbi:Nin one binding Zn-ribbon like-domain-containing protein [Apiospora marii]|uniref:20S-pre-rRNA D-site endonuclease NOB1 n=1 Tax=Apiospora marii TaxID=335849 RepID=A0ABR1R5D9_9PEZI